MIFFNMKMVNILFKATLVFMLLGLMSCKKSDEEYIKLSIDFDDTSNRKSNYTFMYKLEDKNHNEIENGLVDLNFFSNMQLVKKEEAEFIDIYISSEENPDSLGTETYVYSDEDVMNINTDDILQFYVVDQTRFSIKTHENNDVELTIKNKRNSDYNLVSIIDKNRVKILYFVVNNNWNKILLSDLLKVDSLDRNERYDTDTAFRLFGEIESLVDGEEYSIRLKSGKVTSRNTLKYLNYDGFPLKFKYSHVVPKE